jgi:uncharacterized protein (DUF2267 family)
MTDDEFLDDVRSRARLEARRDAELAATAVLTRVAGRLSLREQRDLAAVLPVRLRRRVLAAANTDLAYSPGAAFVRDLADELLVGRREAERIAAAVGAAVAELLSGDELRDLKAELHDTYAIVFAA